MNSLIIFCAKYLIVGVGLIGLALWLQVNKKTKIKLAVATVSALTVAYVLSKIASKLYYDPRPFVKNPSQAPLFAHAADNGFPSDHSWVGMTVAAILFYYRKNLAWLASGLAIIVGVSRVLAHVHSPIDIIAGFAIGAIAAIAGQMVAKRLLLEKSTPVTSNKDT